MNKGKSRELTIEQKLEVIEESETKGVSQRKLAENYNVSKSQIQRILANKKEIRKSLKNSTFANRRRISGALHYSDIDRLTYEWYILARGKNLSITGPRLQTIALAIAEKRGNYFFVASNGWLDSFKKRHNIVLHALNNNNNESIDVSPPVLSVCQDNLMELCKGYERRDIYNMDETGLFFKAIPSDLPKYKNEKCLGGQLASKRFTVAFLCNAAGEKEKPLIIGKANEIYAFKNLDIEETLPIYWRYDPKSWMTSQIFQEWIQTFDWKMKKEKRNVVIFLDNANCHVEFNCENVKLVFLPTSTSSAQPLNQGIIKCFKAMYRKRLMEYLLACTYDVSSAADVAKKINVLDACDFVAKAWSDVAPEIIQQCFTSAGFMFGESSVVETQALSLAIINNELITEMNNEYYSDLINLDAESSTSPGLSDNWEDEFFTRIQEDLKESDNDSSEDDADNSKEPHNTVFPFQEALKVCGDLKQFAAYHNSSELYKKFSTAVDVITTLEIKRRKQIQQELINSYIQNTLSSIP